jgi:hypothetical protein
MKLVDSGEYSVGTGTYVDLSEFGLSQHCILTNHHVVPNEDTAKRIFAYFIHGSIEHPEKVGEYRWYKHEVKFVLTSPRVGTKNFLPGFSVPRDYCQHCRKGDCSDENILEDGGLDFTILELVMESVDSSAGNKATQPLDSQGYPLKPLKLAPIDDLQIDDEVYVCQFPAFQSDLSQEVCYKKPDNGWPCSLDNTLQNIVQHFGGLPRKLLSSVGGTKVVRIGNGSKENHYSRNEDGSPFKYYTGDPTTFKGPQSGTNVVVTWADFMCGCAGSFFHVEFLNVKSGDYTCHQGSSGAAIIKIDGSNPRIVGVSELQVQ